MKIHSWRSMGLVVAWLLMVAGGSAAHGQGAIGGGGIYVDADGVLQARELELDARQVHGQSRAWKDLCEQDGLVCVSLPRLFEQARLAIEAGEPIPEAAAYLGGMVQIRYIQVNPSTGDLILAGLRDEVDDADPWRPIGRQTGRPVLRLEDLVVALRTVGPGARNGRFGCSIDMPEGAQQRFVDALNRSRRASRRERMEQMARAVGPQQARFWGVTPDTRFAAVCLEADYRMKRLALGLDHTPVRGVRSAVTGNAQRYTRCWFLPEYEPLRVSADGSQYELRGPRLKLDTSSSAIQDNAPASESAERFARQATEKMGELSVAIPSWADLANLTDLAVVAALIRTDRLHERVQWDLAWVLDDEDGYPVTRYEVPDQVQTLVTSLRSGYAAGGVVMDLAAIVAQREEAEDGPRAGLARPDADDSLTWSVASP